MSSVKESDEVVSHEDQPETDSQVSKSLTDKKNAVLESYESLTVSDNEACNLPSQKEALICSSPKKRKRLRDPSRILSPKHQQGKTNFMDNLSIVFLLTCIEAKETCKKE